MKGRHESQPIGSSSSLLATIKHSKNSHGIGLVMVIGVLVHFSGEEFSLNGGSVIAILNGNWLHT